MRRCRGEEGKRRKGRRRIEEKLPARVTLRALKVTLGDATWDSTSVRLFDRKSRRCNCLRIIHPASGDAVTLVTLFFPTSTSGAEPRRRKWQGRS